LAGILFIISAPSGSGKSTIVSELRKQVTGVDFAISWTTRAPRGSEENGREYYFATRQEFERMIAEGVFLEHAEVFGHLYGTARKSLDDARAAGHDLILDIDVQGAEQVRGKLREARKEIEKYRDYGYILVNDILDRAVAQLEAIVLAERFYRNGEAIAYRSRRVLEVAAACLQANSQERLKPVLEAFGIIGTSSQQELKFDGFSEEDLDEEDPEDD
jgi:guanylate kinase